MKVCPNCGFDDRKSLRRAVRLWRVHFGDLPIWEMINRRWIAVPECTNIPLIEHELKHFFGLKDADDLRVFLDAPKRMPCQIFDDIGRLIHAPKENPSPQVAKEPKPKKAKPQPSIKRHGLMLVASK